MNKHRIHATAIPNEIRCLMITLAYAEYKIRHAGDLDNDLCCWTDNIVRFIQKEKSRGINVK